MACKRLHKISVTGFAKNREQKPSSSLYVLLSTGKVNGTMCSMEKGCPKARGQLVLVWFFMACFVIKCVNEFVFIFFVFLQFTLSHHGCFYVHLFSVILSLYFNGGPVFGLMDHPPGFCIF